MHIEFTRTQSISLPFFSLKKWQMLATTERTRCERQHKTFDANGNKLRIVQVLLNMCGAAIDDSMTTHTQNRNGSTQTNTKNTITTKRVRTTNEKKKERKKEIDNEQRHDKHPFDGTNK